MRKVILLVLVLLFLGCGTTVSIKQKTRVDDICDCTYWITTQVWVKKHWGQTIISLEHHECRYNVPKDEVKALEQWEYEKAIVVAERIRQCIEEGTCP